MPVILYGRVSTVRDPNSKSVDDQLRELRAWADREGWTVVAVFRDDNISASRYARGKKRTGWEDVVSHLMSGTVRGGALLVWELSRGTRDKKVAAALEQTCIEAGVKIGYKGELRDPSTAEGGFTVGLDALLAARESDVISERTKRAVDGRAAAGRLHGRLGFGYRRTIDPRTGHTTGWEIDPERGPVFREIVDRVLGGDNLTGIANDLNRRGIFTEQGNPWRATNLPKMLQRPSYAGLRVHNGQVLQGVTGSWPPLLTLEQHLELVALFADPERDKFRSAGVVKFLGSGLFRCGRDGCDGRMRVNAGWQGRNRRYDCAVCHRVSRRQDKVDELVEGTMVLWLSRGDFLSRVAEREQAPAVTRAAAEEVTRLRGKLAQLRAAWDEDRISLDAYSEMESKTLRRIEEAEATAKQVRVPRALVDAAGDEAEARWSAMSLGAKREALAAVMSVTILPTVPGRWAWDPTRVRVEWR